MENFATKKIKLGQFSSENEIRLASKKAVHDNTLQVTIEFVFLSCSERILLGCFKKNFGKNEKNKKRLDFQNLSMSAFHSFCGIRIFFPLKLLFRRMTNNDASVLCVYTETIAPVMHPKKTQTF